MTATQNLQAIVAQLDQNYLVRTLTELAKVPTEIPLGPETFMEPDDPKLVHYVQRELRPRLQALGIYDIADVPKNQLVTRLGSGDSGKSLLVMVYTPTQHHNQMDDPLSGKVGRAAEWGSSIVPRPIERTISTESTRVTLP